MKPKKKTPKPKTCPDHGGTPTVAEGCAKGWCSMVAATKQLTLTTAKRIACLNRQEWRMARQSGIGSSDAAAIWGVSKWQSPYAVVWHKLGELEPDEPDIMQRVGHALEPFIAELFTEATGVETIDSGDFTIFQHGEIPYLMATPDRLTKAGEIVELKTASFQSAKEWKEHIPLAYQIQLAHQMCVLGVETAYIAVLINGSDFRHHRLDRSPTFERKHIAKCVDFWQSYVANGEYPPPDYSDATASALASRYAQEDGPGIALPESLNELGEEYDGLCAAISTAERRKSEIQNVVKEALGTHPIGRLGDSTGFSWKGKPRRFGRIKKEIDL